MFKDTKERSTHHHEDSCYKCKICNSHMSYLDQFTTQMCEICLRKEIKKWNKEIKQNEQR